MQRSKIAGDRSGASSVEFAIALPLLLGLLVGSAELTRLMIAERQFLRAANALGDMMVRQRSTSDQSIQQLFDGVEAMLGEAAENGLSIVVSGIERNGAAMQAGEFEVAWSNARDAAPLGQGSRYVFADNRSPQGDFYVVVNMNANYGGALTQLFVRGRSLHTELQFAPRDSERVDLVDGNS